LIIEVSHRNHWELQVSNPEKGPKSDENDPSPLSEFRRLATGLPVIG